MATHSSRTPLHTPEQCLAHLGSFFRPVLKGGGARLDDVAAGHLLAYEKGATGRRYILGGEDMLLRDILHTVAGIAGVKPPVMQIPRGPIYPIAWAAETWCKLTGRGEPFATVDGLKMSKKKMFFSSSRAESELGYRHRLGEEALRDAVTWFRQNGYLPRP